MSRPIRQYQGADLADFVLNQPTNTGKKPLLKTSLNMNRRGPQSVSDIHTGATTAT
jgi:hypothetical protein